jgi:hypothetical protein
MARFAAFLFVIGAAGFAVFTAGADTGQPVAPAPASVPLQVKSAPLEIRSAPLQVGFAPPRDRLAERVPSSLAPCACH